MSEDGDADTWDNIYDDDGRTLVTDHQLQPDVDLPNQNQNVNENQNVNVNESVNNCQNEVDNKPNQFIFNSFTLRIAYLDQMSSLRIGLLNQIIKLGRF